MKTGTENSSIISVPVIHENSGIAVIALLFFITVLFGCSRQEGITPELFIQRAESQMKNVTFDTANSFYDDSGYHCFCSMNERLYIISCKTDKKNIVCETSLTSESNAIDDDMKYICAELIELFSEEELADNIIETISQSAKEYPFHYETQWFDYSMAKTKSGCCMTIHDKKLMKQTLPELTLKENDLAAYK